VVVLLRLLHELGRNLADRRVSAELVLERDRLHLDDVDDTDV
jgi:hypothetical protein